MADRIKFKRGSLKVVLNSPATRAAVAAIAEATAARARAATDDEIVVQNAGKKRARSYVTRLGSGAAGEAKDRALGRSIGGA